MKLRVLVGSFVASLLFGAVAHAATVTIVHGINGKDLGTAKALPVDIAVNGSCALKGVRFTQSTKVELAAGRYVVTVHPADGACGLDPVITKNIEFTSNDDYSKFSAVASLSANGTPQIAIFNDTATAGLSVGAAVRHVAAAGAVTVKFSSSVARNLRAQTIRNKKQAQLSVLGSPVPYTAKIFAGRTLLASKSGRPFNSYDIWNIVGSSKNGFTLIRQTFKYPKSPLG